MHSKNTTLRMDETVQFKVGGVSLPVLHTTATALV